MPKITVPSKGQFPDSINAASLFIDSVSNDLSIIVELFFSDGTKEKQEVVSGSKFLTGIGAGINKINFINRGLASIDVEYHFSTIASYDEARVIGDVNALVRNANLTNDGNQFFQAFKVMPVNYGYLLIENPVGSNVRVNIDRFKIKSSGASYSLIKTNAVFGAYIGTLDNKVLYGAQSKAKLYRTDDASSALATVLSAMKVNANEILPFDFENSPITLDEGEAFGVVGAVGQELSTIFEISEDAL